MRLYLDVCIICRPYDDQKMMRIRLETDAKKKRMESVERHRSWQESLNKDEFFAEAFK
jgi:hypothetical protein